MLADGVPRTRPLQLPRAPAAVLGTRGWSLVGEQPRSSPIVERRSSARCARDPEGSAGACWTFARASSAWILHTSTTSALHRLPVALSVHRPRLPRHVRPLETDRSWTARVTCRPSPSPRSPHPATPPRWRFTWNDARFSTPCPRWRGPIVRRARHLRTSALTRSILPSTPGGGVSRETHRGSARPVSGGV